MTLTDEQKKIGEQVAELLAQSNLADEIKENLLKNLDKMPEPILQTLLESLERERQALVDFSDDIKTFDQKQAEDWQKLEADQQVAADKIVDQFVADTEKDAKVQSIKENL